MLTRPVAGRELGDVHVGRMVGAAENAESMARLGRSVTLASSHALEVVRLPAAQREQLPYLGFLAELVMAECDDRDKAAPPRTARQLPAHLLPAVPLAARMSEQVSDAQQPAPAADIIETVPA